MAVTQYIGQGTRQLTLELINHPHKVQVRIQTHDNLDETRQRVDVGIQQCMQPRVLNPRRSAPRGMVPPMPDLDLNGDVFARFAKHRPMHLGK